MFGDLYDSDDGFVVLTAGYSYENGDKMRMARITFLIFFFSFFSGE